MHDNDCTQRAAELLANADALVSAADAGMGMNFGFLDFLETGDI
jgi:hypothetical protein